MINLVMWLVGLELVCRRVWGHSELQAAEALLAELSGPFRVLLGMWALKTAHKMTENYKFQQVNQCLYIPLFPYPLPMLICS